MKTCTQCDTEKPASEFYPKGKLKSGRIKLEPCCKDCSNARRKASYHAKARANGVPTREQFLSQVRKPKCCRCCGKELLRPVSKCVDCRLADRFGIDANSRQPMADSERQWLRGIVKSASRLQYKIRIEDRYSRDPWIKRCENVLHSFRTRRPRSFVKDISNYGSGWRSWDDLLTAAAHKVSQRPMSK